jgi:hypothetical protein
MAMQAFCMDEMTDLRGHAHFDPKIQCALTGCHICAEFVLKKKS